MQLRDNFNQPGSARRYVWTLLASLAVTAAVGLMAILAFGVDLIVWASFALGLAYAAVSYVRLVMALRYSPDPFAANNERSAMTSQFTDISTGAARRIGEHA